MSSAGVGTALEPLSVTSVEGGQYRYLQILWVLILATSPVYTFSSGLPQPADFLTILLIGVIGLIGYRVRKDVQPAVIAAASFAWYVAIVNFIWALVLGSSGLLQAPFFYLFNVMVLICCVSMYDLIGDRFLKTTLDGIFWSLVLLIVTLPVTFQPGAFRQTLMFNNPNQLGYYGLLSGTILALGRRHSYVHGWYWGLGMAMSMLMILLATSKGAILGGLVLLCLVLYGRPWATVAIIGAAAAAVPIILANATEFVRVTMWRLSPSGGGADDNFAGRGYDRIVNHKEYLFFGAGEGDYRRFESILPNELHSSWATIVFAYGVIGTVLFCIFFWRVLRSTNYRHLPYFLPVLLYGVTHQGLRTTAFWVLLAFSMLIGVSMKRSSDRITAGQPSG